MNTRIAAAFALLAVMCGCGQVGPLYLPEDQTATTTEVPVTTGAASGDAAAPAPDAGGTGTVPDRTNEPRRRAH